MAQAGKIREFDKLAFEFSAAKSEHKPVVLEDAEAAAAKSDSEMAKYYVKVSECMLAGPSTNTPPAS